MRRTQIYLTEEEWGRLASISRDRGMTKSALIREAVDQAHLVKPSKESFSKALWAVYGLWKNRAPEEFAPSRFSRTEYAKLAKKLAMLKKRPQGKIYSTTGQARRHLDRLMRS